MTGGGDKQDPKQKAEEFLRKIRESNDVTNVESKDSKPSVGTLDAETFKYMLDHGQIVQLKKDDLEPAYDREGTISLANDKGEIPPNKVKSDGTFETPIYVIPGVAPDKSSIQLVEIDSGKNKGGSKQFILASEGDHKYDADYYRTHMQASNADIQQNPKLAKSDTYDGTPENTKRYNDLLAYVSEEAKRQGIEPPTVLLDKTSTHTDAHAFDSKEGQHYLSLSVDRMAVYLQQAANSNDEKALDGLKAELKNEITRIKTGSTTPSGTVVEKEEKRLVDASHLNSDVPKDNITVSDAALDKLVQNGKLIKREQSDLMPNADSNPVLHNSGNIPIYMTSDATPDSGNSVTPDAKLMHTKEGKPYIIINDGYNKWSESDVRNRMPTEARKAEEIAGKHTFTPDEYRKQLTGDEQSRFDALAKFMTEKSKEIGSATFVVSGDIDAGTGGAAETTREGKHWVNISKDALEAALKSNDPTKLEQLKAVLQHEIDHIKDGDTTVQGLMKKRDAEQSRQMESRADLGVDNPQALANYLKAGAADEIPGYLKDNPNTESAKRLKANLIENIPEYLKDNKDKPDAQLSDQYNKTGKLTEEDLKKVANWTADNNKTDKLTEYDMRKVSDWSGKKFPTHPATDDRINALQDAAEVRKEYEKTHTITTDADRQAESRFVTAKVEQDMNGLGTLPMPVASANLPPDVPATVLPKGTIDPNSASHIELNVPASKGAAEISSPQANATTQDPARPNGLSPDHDAQIANIKTTLAKTASPVANITAAPLPSGSATKDIPQTNVTATAAKADPETTTKANSSEASQDAQSKTAFSATDNAKIANIKTTLATITSPPKDIPSTMPIVATSTPTAPSVTAQNSLV